MIPKQLFFIWFGDTKPNYVDFCIDSFKKNNPDFKINFLRYTISQIEKREKVSEFDNDVYYCLDLILDEIENPYKNLIMFYKKIRKTLQVLSNVLRLYLLNKYGGIYLDCDTYSINPFDEKLINKEEFIVTNYYGIKKYPDIFFFGKSNINKYYTYFNKNNFKYKIDIHDNYEYRDKKWLDNRTLFFNIKNLDINSKYYIDHFEDKSWYKSKRTPICKYDK